MSMHYRASVKTNFDLKPSFLLDSYIGKCSNESKDCEEVDEEMESAAKNDIKMAESDEEMVRKDSEKNEEMMRDNKEEEEMRKFSEEMIESEEGFLKVDDANFAVNAEFMHDNQEIVQDENKSYTLEEVKALNSHVSELFNFSKNIKDIDMLSYCELLTEVDNERRILRRNIYALRTFSEDLIAHISFPIVLGKKTRDRCDHGKFQIILDREYIYLGLNKKNQTILHNINDIVKCEKNCKCYSRRAEVPLMCFKPAKGSGFKEFKFKVIKIGIAGSEESCGRRVSHLNMPLFQIDMNDHYLWIEHKFISKLSWNKYKGFPLDLHIEPIRRNELLNVPKVKQDVSKKRKSKSIENQASTPDYNSKHFKSELSFDSSNDSFLSSSSSVQDDF